MKRAILVVDKKYCTSESNPTLNWSSGGGRFNSETCSCSLKTFICANGSDFFKRPAELVFLLPDWFSQDLRSSQYLEVILGLAPELSSRLQTQARMGSWTPCPAALLLLGSPSQLPNWARCLSREYDCPEPRIKYYDRSILFLHNLDVVKRVHVEDVRGNVSSHCDAAV